MPATRRLVALACAVGLAAVGAPAASADVPPGCSSADRPGGEWNGYGRDYANTRTQPHERVIAVGDVPTLSPAWTFSTVRAGGRGDITGTPAVVDGCMYVATNRGWVFAVNADNGRLAWRARIPYGGGVNSSVAVANRRCDVTESQRTRGRRRRGRRRGGRRRQPVFTGRHTRRHRRRTRGRTRTRTIVRHCGTVYVAVTRTSRQQGCPENDPCRGPYVVAFDQRTGDLVWATPPIDLQDGADVYGTPVIFDGVLMLGVSGGSAELGDEADRYAFQGSMNFLDATTGEVLEKT